MNTKIYFSNIVDLLLYQGKPYAHIIVNGPLPRFYAQGKVSSQFTVDLKPGDNYKLDIKF